MSVYVIEEYEKRRGNVFRSDQVNVPYTTDNLSIMDNIVNVYASAHDR